ncbi:MAG: hypothetical protein ACRCX2_21175 [Paraclostridium sp.]
MNEFWVIERIGNGEFWTGEDFIADTSLAYQFGTHQQAKNILNSTIKDGWYGKFDIYTLYDNPLPNTLKK